MSTSWTSAAERDPEFEAKAENARQRPKPYKSGRVKDTREIVVRPNCVMGYRVTGDPVEMLRMLHTVQQCP